MLILQVLKFSSYQLPIPCLLFWIEMGGPKSKLDWDEQYLMIQITIACVSQDYLANFELYIDHCRSQPNVNLQATANFRNRYESASVVTSC